MLALAPCDDDDAAAALDMRATGMDHLVTQHRAKLGQMTASLVDRDNLSASPPLSAFVRTESRNAMRAESTAFHPGVNAARSCCCQ
jgi:hypothetical protein